MSKAARNYPGRNEVRVGRVGVIIPVLVACGLLVPACGQGSSVVPKKPNPVRVTTETVSTGWFTQIFDTSLAADPAQASAVEGFRAALILWNKSQETMKLVAPVTAYVTGTALGTLKATLVREKAQDVVIGGTDRFFETRVTVISGTNATITTCDDGSKFEEVNPSTDVPDPAYSAPANQQYLFETWQMTRLDGHWAISGVSPVTLPDSRAKPCQPLPALDTASTHSHWLVYSSANAAQASSCSHEHASPLPRTPPGDRHRQGHHQRPGPPRRGVQARTLRWLAAHDFYAAPECPTGMSGSAGLRR